MDIFKNLIDKRRRTIVEDEARSQLLTLGEEFLSSVSVKDICKFLDKFGIAHEDDLAKAPEEEIRALLKEWLAPPVEEALVDADGKSSSASETSSGKTSDDPLNLVLEKLESFSSRLSALEGGNLINSSDEAGGWLDQLSKDAQRAVSESGFHVGPSRPPRISRFAHRNRSGSTLRGSGSGGRSFGRSVTNLQPPCKDPEVIANLPFRILKVRAIGGVSTIAISNTTGVAGFTLPKAPSSSEKLSGATH